jgi:hypothetical protein
MLPINTDDCTLPAGMLLLAAVTRGDPRAVLAQNLAAVQEAGQDIVDLARTHGLSSLLFLRLEESNLADTLPPNRWEELHRAHLVTAARSHAVVSATAEVIRQLHDGGVRHCLPFKGAAMAAACSPDYLPRYITDIDLLVAPEEMPTAIARLSEAHWQQSAALHYLDLHQRFHFSRDAMVTDLHCSLWRSGSLLTLLPVLPVAVPTMLARSRATTLDDLRVPGVADDLIIQAILLARDRYAVPLSRWADLFRVAANFDEPPDWDRLQTLAAEHNCAGLVWLALRFAEDLFATPLCHSLSAPTGWEGIYTDLRPLLQRRLLLAGDKLLCSKWFTRAVVRRALQCPVTTQPSSQALHAALAESADRFMGKQSLRLLVYPLYVAGSMLRSAAKLACIGEARRGLRDDIMFIRCLRALTAPL